MRWFVTLLLLPALAGYALPAAAGRWQATGGFSVDADYSGNVFLDAQRDDVQEDLLLRLRPRMRATRTGSRASASISYVPEFRYYTMGSYDSRLVHFLQANGDVELVEHWFGLRGSASAGQSVINQADRFTGDGAFNPDNVTDTFVVRVSPYLLPQSVGRYFTWSLSGDFDFVAFSNDQVENDRSRGVRLNVASGPAFSRFHWKLNYRTSLTTFDESTNRTRERVDANLEYDLTRIYSLLARIGHDFTDAETDGRLDGVDWKVGLRWDPNPRANATFWLGKRFGRADFEFDIRYSRRHTSLFARFNRDLSEVRNELSDQTLFADQNVFGEAVADPTLDEASTGVDVSGPTLSNALYIRDAFRFGVSVDMRRGGLSLEAFYNRRDAVDRNDDTDDRGVQLRLSRTLTPKSTASINASYRDFRNRLNADGDYRQWSTSFQISRKLSKANLQFRYTVNSRDADVGSNDFTEERVLLRWIQNFDGGSTTNFQ